MMEDKNLTEDIDTRIKDHATAQMPNQDKNLHLRISAVKKIPFATPKCQIKIKAMSMFCSHHM